MTFRTDGSTEDYNYVTLEPITYINLMPQGYYGHQVDQSYTVISLIVHAGRL